jgi:tripartite-type tricarboxylate transporter receptor subunit TctC
LTTLAEAGIKGIEAAAWKGIVAPSGTPVESIQKLNAEMNKALASSDIRSRLAAQGADILVGTPAEYAA